MTPFLAVALWLAVPTAFLVVAAWLIEHRDAEQGPPPTLRPDVRAACEDAWAAEVYAREWDRQQAWDAHVAQMLRLVSTEGTPQYDRLVCERIEAAEGLR